MGVLKENEVIYIVKTSTPTSTQTFFLTQNVLNQNFFNVPKKILTKEFKSKHFWQDFSNKLFEQNIWSYFLWFNHNTIKFCFAILFLHGSHRSYPSRRRACFLIFVKHRHFVDLIFLWLASSFFFVLVQDISISKLSALDSRVVIFIW